jgi:hypothetical protein
MSTEIVTFDIVINGKPISGDINVISLEIDQNKDVNIARIEIEADETEWPITINNEFKLSDNILISLGYNASNSTAFEGTITDRGVRLSQGAGAKNIFICEGTNVFKQATAYIDPTYIYNIDLGYDKEKNVEGGIEIQGSLEYKAGNTIDLSSVVEGCPQTTIHSVMHEVSNGNWFSSLHFIKPEPVEPEAVVATQESVITTTENTAPVDKYSGTEKEVTISDANGNSITLNSSGINIKSSKDITISANEFIIARGGLGIKQEAVAGDVTISGLNTKINADMTTSINGSIATTIKAGTELTLKGAMVMIN